MAKLLRLRRGTTTQHGSFTGAEGEVTVDTDKDTLVVHDNATAGGRPMLREDLNNMPASGVTAGTYGSSSAIPSITVDTKGRVTSATTNAIDSTSITNGTSNVSVAASGDITVTRAGSTKATFNSAGIDVPGTLTCNQLIVDDDGSGSPTLRVSGDDNSPWGLVVNNNTYTSNANLGFRALQQNDGSFLMDYSGDGSYETILIRSGNGTTEENCISIDSNRAVNLHHANSTKLTTTASGINVTGTVNCDGLTCDGAATIESSAGILNIKDNDSTGNAVQNFIRGRDSADSTRWQIGHASTGNQDLYVSNLAGGQIQFQSSGSTRFTMQAAGHLVPESNNTIDLGTSSNRWRNVYTNDLNLSNEGGANDVDGTWGNWTIQEGEDDLFLLNRRNGKKYKFNLSEVN